MSMMKLPVRENITYPRFAPVGDTAFTVEFGDTIDAGVNDRVRAFDRAVAASNIPGIVETVPSFRSVLVIYEPELIDGDALIGALSALIRPDRSARATAGRSWSIPVAYGYPDDADLRVVADATGLTPEEVIGIHSSAEYRIFLIGFVPGLPVLGGLPEPLHVPRRPAPRHGIPAGRVMIGGMQGLIVPMPMPTGYHSLGQTPVRPYDRSDLNAFLFRTGDRIRFRPVMPDELDDLAAMPPRQFMTVAA